MDLTQLQAELRAVENKMSELQAEIEKMKPRSQADLAADYAKIARSAKQAPVNNLLVSAADDYTKKSYLSGLAYLSFAGQPVDMDRLLYLTALSIGIGCGYEPENLVTLGMRMDENAFEAVSEAVRPYRISFMTDAFVLANMTGAAETSMLEALTGMAHILGCTADDMKVIAAVAKAVLTQDFDALDKVSPELACQYTGQFTGNIPESWLAKRRIVRNTMMVDSASLMWTMHSKEKTYVSKPPANGTTVHKNQEIAVLKNGMDTSTYRAERVSITAPIHGIVYTLQRKEVNKLYSRGMHTAYDTLDYLYVISPFDTLANLEKWHDKQHPHPEKE